MLQPLVGVKQPSFSTNNGGTAPTETLSLNFTKIEFKYKPQSLIFPSSGAAHILARRRNRRTLARAENQGQVHAAQPMRQITFLARFRF